MTTLRLARPLAFVIAGALAGVTAAAAEDRQEPPLTPYRVDEISLRMAGTLTIPRSGGPFPAVLLLRGPGPQNRDDALYQNRPFVALVDHLTRLGVAVLQMDLRGVGFDDRGPGTTTTTDFARDVRDGLAYLKSHRDIVPERIGLLGHGEGASIAGMVAASNLDVAFTVLLAASGVPGDEFFQRQFASLAQAQGASAPVIARELEVRQRVFDLVKSETDGVANLSRRRALAEELMNALSPEETEHTRRLVDSLLQTASTPWFRFFIAYDPRVDLARVRTPVLALTGGADLQAPHRDNLPPIRAALERAGNADVTVNSLPGLNHLLQAKGADTMSPAVLKLVGAWVLERAARD
jgi:pimeloyl-ACP methyl ester carboxylesterase